MLVGVSSAAVSPDRYREELARIMASGTLKNNPALRKLLAYLAEASLSGPPEALKEYSIGREVMGKPPDYDPRIDSSVRVQIGKLRLKLEEYYSKEAPGATAQLMLPRGGFEIVYSERPAQEKPPVNRWKLAAIFSSALALLLAAAVAALLAGQPASVSLSPEAKSLWAPFLNQERPLMIALGVPFFIRFGPVFFRNPYMNDLETARKSLDLDAIQRAVAPGSPARESRRFSGLGEASALFEVTRLLAPHHARLVLKRASVLDWEDLRANNMVIIGPPKFAPQTRDLPIQQEFVFEGTSIINLRPAPGEAVRFHKLRAEDPEVIDEDFGLITYATGLSGWGDLLILASSSTEATWAAAEAVTQPHYLKRLWPRLCSSDGRLPPSWQLVVRAKFRNQVPIEIQYVTHRVLRPK